MQMKKYDAKVIEGYTIEVTEDEIYITERVNNSIFGDKTWTQGLQD